MGYVLLDETGGTKKRSLTEKPGPDKTKTAAVPASCRSNNALNNVAVSGASDFCRGSSMKCASWFLL